ncbi:MAG: transglycosylase domain-containing protein [Candidatus Binatia bacterium]
MQAKKLGRKRRASGAAKKWLGRWRSLLVPRRWAARGTTLLFLAAALIAAGIGAWRTCGFRGCPEVDRLTAYQPGGASLLLDRHGKPFASLAPVKREVVPLHTLPAGVAQAFIAIEDQRFLEHHGIDWRRVVGATFANLRAGFFKEWFSTITMQLARNVFPERIQGQERTATRKLLEMRVAREIERKFSKQEILELYVNHIYFGNGARGIAAASQYYFRKPAARLTLPQAALLAALPKAPSHYDPRRHPKAALARRNLVLAMLEQQQRVPLGAIQQAKKAPLGISAKPPRQKHDPSFAPYFAEEVRRVLEQQFGARIYADPVRIWTTLDMSVQRTAEEELERQLAAVEQGRFGSFTGPRYTVASAPKGDGTPYLQGAVVMLGVQDGDVLAWVGGRDFRHSQFDRVARARRQAGSTFKPFVYAAALAGGYALSQPLSDDPLRMKLANGEVWEPRNFADRYDGQVTIRDALVRSKNVATVRLAGEVGYAKVAELAHRVGIKGVIPEHPSMSLGTMTVSPLELTAAYTAFAGLGQVVAPRVLLRIESPDGRLLWQSQPERRRVLDPGVAFLVNDTLQEVLERGSGTTVRQTGFRGPAAGKTGTSNEGADAWFVGHTSAVVTGVWIGFDQPRTITDRATGGTLAAPLWGRVMARLYEGNRPPVPWRVPRNIVERVVDPATGLVLARGCRPIDDEAYQEMFLAEMEPEVVCPSRESAPRGGFFTRRRSREELPDPEEALFLARREERALPRVEDAERTAQEWPDKEIEPSAEEIARIAEEEKSRKEQDAQEAPLAPAATDLNGWWELTNQIESTSYSAYQGLRLGYRLFLRQEGKRITGQGQKWAENGRGVPSSRQTPITLTGSINGSSVQVTFTEHGAQRRSGGSFHWQLSPDQTSLQGSFSSSAASTSGSSVARRIP